MDLITSPASMPAAWAGYPSTTPASRVVSYPVIPMSTMERPKARIKLNTGPAATTEILAHTDLLLNALSSVIPSSSPSIMQEPPNGSILKEYRVPPFSKLNSLGPMPRENSITPIPFNFANKKWPNS